MEYNEQQPNTSIQIVPANHAKRFANYLIDLIFFSFPASFLLMALAPSNAWAANLVYDLTKKPEALTWMDQFMMWFVYSFYISFMEAMLRGKTIGKYITRTRAVSRDGLPVNSQTAFARGLIRLIPFEQFSALSMPCRPWHDRWSGSAVADENKSLLPKNS